MDQKRTEELQQEMPSQPKPTPSPAKKRIVDSGKTPDDGTASSSQPPKKRGRSLAKLTPNTLLTEEMNSEAAIPGDTINFGALNRDSPNTRPGRAIIKSPIVPLRSGPAPVFLPTSPRTQQHPHYGGKTPQLRPASTQAPSPATPQHPQVTSPTQHNPPQMRYPPQNLPVNIPIITPANPLPPYVLDLVTVFVGLTTRPNHKAATLCLSTCPPYQDIPLGSIYLWLAEGTGISSEHQDRFKHITVTYPWKPVGAKTQPIRYNHLANDLEVMCKFIREKWQYNECSPMKLIHIEMFIHVFLDDPEPGLPLMEAGPGAKIT